MKITIRGFYDNVDEATTYNSLLEAAKEERVFEIYRDEETGKIWIGELCDQCFGFELTGEQLRALGEEIILLSESI